MDIDVNQNWIDHLIWQARPLDEDTEDEDDQEDDIEDDDDIDDDDLEAELEHNNLVMGAYMAESFKDLHVGSDIEQLFLYIEDYKPVHLDLEDSGTNLFATAANSQPIQSPK